jgi:hypothetical protein
MHSLAVPATTVQLFDPILQQGFAQMLGKFQLFESSSRVGTGHILVKAFLQLIRMFPFWMSSQPVAIKLCILQLERTVRL